MKQFFLIVLFGLWSVSIYTQTICYTDYNQPDVLSNTDMPLLEDGKSWFSVMFGFEPPIKGTISSIIGDTLFSGQTYYVMTELVFDYGESMSNHAPQKYFLREDISAAKVYQYDPDFYEEKLIYDFSLSIGDTLPMQPEYVLRSITEGSTPVTRRNFIFINENNDSIVWVEGIGNYSNVLQPTAIKHENISKIICVEQNDSIVYDAGSFKGWVTCDDKPNTDLSSLKSAGIGISPTITNKYIDIVGDVNLDYCEIFDANGIRVICSIQKTIDVSGLSNGIYLVVIHEAKRHHTHKFIKI